MRSSIRIAVPDPTTATALPPRLEARTGFLLAKAAQRGHEIMAECLSPFGLKARHYGVLALIADDGPSGQQRMCERLWVDRTTMAKIVDDLEALGLAARRVDPANRRANLVELTSVGRRRLAKIDAAVSIAEEALFAPFTDAERAQLHTVLRRLVEGVRSGQP